MHAIDYCSLLVLFVSPEIKMLMCLIFGYVLFVFLGFNFVSINTDGSKLIGYVSILA